MSITGLWEWDAPPEVQDLLDAALVRYRYGR